jgi:Mrp family chromosome partitioning ATPase
MYEAFVTRLRETQDQYVIQSPDARVISRAAVPTVPSSPKRMLILAMSIPAGLLLGLLIALVLERISGPVRVERPARPFRPVPAPARVPVLAKLDGIQDPRAAVAVLDYPNSDFARATARLLEHAMRKGSVVAVTAPGRGNAKTTAATALARLAARMGMRVAVVDATLADPKTACAFGVGPVRFGLVETLLGRVPLARALCRDPRSNARILPVAQPARDPDAVLASERMAGLIAHLGRACDLVVIDAPAGRRSAVERLADTTFLVAEDGRVAMR